MAEPPDFDTLARRYIDLWQDQVAAMAADPEVSGLMGRLVQAMAMGPAGVMAMWTAAAKQESDGIRRSSPDPSAAAGTASARSASGDGHDDVDELRRRLAAVEEQVARLEAERGVASDLARAQSGTRARSRPGRARGA